MQVERIGVIVKSFNYNVKLYFQMILSLSLPSSMFEVRCISVSLEIGDILFN